MESRPYTVKYEFRAGDSVLQEICYTDVPPDSPPSKRFQWVHIVGESPSTCLTFLSRSQNTRVFQDETSALTPI